MGRLTPLDLFTGQEPSDPARRDEVLAARSSAAFTATEADVRAALGRTRRTRADLAALLSPAAAPLLEDLAAHALVETRARFGTSVALFSPLYISNYCANACTYCGFTCTNTIARARLEGTALTAELRALADQGVEDVLILTGESLKFAGTDFIAGAVRQAAGMFRSVGVEVQPMNTDEYATLHEAGADWVHVYQETYSIERYGQVHLGGRKRSYVYRFDAQERALNAGMHGVGFGSLLGLEDPRRDALATAVHAETIQRDFPEAQLSLSCPRIRPTGADTEGAAQPVDERLLLQILCAYRLFLPQASITVSTRERAGFRDAVAGLVATKLSASVHTGVGQLTEESPEGDEQFSIADERNLDEVIAALRGRGLQPVLSEHIRPRPAA